MKKGIQILLWTLVFLSITSYTIFLIQIQNYTVETKTSYPIQPEMQFVFIDTDSTKYKIFQKGIHGARINWDFLFGSDDDETPEENTTKDTYPTGYPTQPEDKDYVDDVIDDMKNKLDDIQISPKYKTCKLPRWETIKHNEYVLAYQQRTDEPNICNIQKRHCKNWKLSGSYTQNACKENRSTHDPDINHHIFTVHHKSRNTDILIQSKNRPNNYDPKIIEKDIPDTIWENNKKWGVYEDKKSNLLPEKEYRQCTSPRWDSIQHGQFIRAYQRAKWFNDVKCTVELRVCLEGTLKWSFKYQECKYINDSYESYYSNPDNRDPDYARDHKQYSDLPYDNSKQSKNELKETQNIITKLKKAISK